MYIQPEKSFAVVLPLFLSLVPTTGKNWGEKKIERELRYEYLEYF